MVAGIICRLKFDVCGVNTSVVDDVGGGGVLSVEVVDLG
jgi:hypothetical protein